VSGVLLVTGAQGFVGRWLVHEAAAAAAFDRIAGIGRSERRDRFTHRATLGAHSVIAPLPHALRKHAGDPTPCAYTACDVRDEEALVAVLRRERPRAIVHLASALRDDPPSALFPVNVEGTIALLRAISRSGVAVERVVLGSSGSVYGAPVTLPVRESDPVRPPDLYAVSKVAAEHAAAVLARELDLAVVVARIFNVVGAGLDERHACARFASQLAAVAHDLAHGSGGDTRSPANTRSSAADGARPRAATVPRVVVGDLTPTRDFVDVRDVATALLALAERGVAGQTYNVASGRETSMQTVLDTLLDIARLRDRVEIARGYHRPVDCPRVVADVSRIAALGCAPPRPLEASLSDVYGYYADAVADAVSEAVADAVSDADADAVSDSAFGVAAASSPPTTPATSRAATAASPTHG
jgi:nucleoside-diphosphate-sugar epimerase